VTRSWLLSALLAATAAAGGCSFEPWSQGQRDEAYRLCRAEVGFPPISVFAESGPGFGPFMCRCEVDYLADRVSHTRFRDILHLQEVNRVLDRSRTYCSVRYRDGDR
jgi:hypothetical protein